MDCLFKKLIEKDKNFKFEWMKTPFIYCEKIGSSHTLADYNYKMENNSVEIKEIIKNQPPYVLKFSSKWNKYS